jgi:hypothetical protein
VCISVESTGGRGEWSGDICVPRDLRMGGWGVPAPRGRTRRYPRVPNTSVDGAFPLGALSFVLLDKNKMKSLTLELFDRHDGFKEEIDSRGMVVGSGVAAARIDGEELRLPRTKVTFRAREHRIRWLSRSTKAVYMKTSTVARPRPFGVYSFSSSPRAKLVHSRI